MATGIMENSVRNTGYYGNTKRKAHMDGHTMFQRGSYLRPQDSKDLWWEDGE